MWKKILLVGLALIGVGLIGIESNLPESRYEPTLEARARVLASEIR